MLRRINVLFKGNKAKKTGANRIKGAMDGFRIQLNEFKEGREEILKEIEIKEDKVDVKKNQIKVLDAEIALDEQEVIFADKTISQIEQLLG